MDSLNIIKTSATFHLLTWMRKNREAFPRYILTAACVFVGFYALWLALTISHPYRAEILQNTLVSMGVLLNICLATFFCICLVALAVWNFGRGVTVTTPDVSGLLWAGKWTEPDISPDVLVCARPGETSDSFVARVDRIKNSACPARWVVIVPFRYPVALIYQTPTRYLDFARECPPFQSDDWAENQRVCPVNTYFVNESEADYQNYLSRFCFYFREWTAKVKVTREDTLAAKIDIFKEGVMASLNICLFLLFSLPAFAQSAQHVEQALGTRIREVPAQGADVTYQFEKKTFGRVGNGRYNYVDLLKNIPAYRDCCHGALIAVYKDGDLVAKGGAAENVAANPAKDMRAHGNSAIPPEQVRGIPWPDSAGMVSAAEQAIDFARHSRYQAELAALPWWNVLMIWIEEWYPLILLIFGLSWVWAKVSAVEGMFFLHKKARRICAVVTLSFGSIMLVHLFLKAMSAGWGNVPLTFLLAAECAVLWWTASKIIPDFAPARGNEPERGGYNTGFPQLRP